MQTYTIYNKIKMVVQSHPLLLKPPRHLNLSSFFGSQFLLQPFAYLCFFSLTLFSAYIFRAFAPLSRRRRTQADDLPRTEAESGTSVKKTKPNIRVYFCSRAILWPDRGDHRCQKYVSHSIILTCCEIDSRKRMTRGRVNQMDFSRELADLRWRKWGETRTKVCEWETNGS